MFVRYSIALAALVAVAAPCSAQVMYTVTDLGLPMNGMFSLSGARAQGINQSGQVTGTATSISPFPSRAFRYSPGVGIIELGSFVTNGTSVGYAINAFGQVAGAATPIGGGQHAFRYTDGSGLVDLGVLPGQVNSQGLGINDLGQVVGQSGSRIFRYTNGVGMVDIGLPGGSFLGGAGVGINNSGQIAASAAPTSTTTRAYRYSDATGFVDLGTLGGPNAQPAGIASNGSVLGFSDTTSGQSHAFLFTDAGGMIDIGTLPGDRHKQCRIRNESLR